MNTGQTLFTIFAFMFFSTMITNFYNTVAWTSDSIMDSQSSILATTISESYAQTANGLAFDSVTDTSYISSGELSKLTSPSALGTENSYEASDIKHFNDFDDFNGKTLTKFLDEKTFTTKFSVYYINSSDMKTYSSTQTFFKRIDMKVWQSYPVLDTSNKSDTLNTFYVKGYFHFN